VNVSGGGKRDDDGAGAGAILPLRVRHSAAPAAGSVHPERFGASFLAPSHNEGLIVIVTLTANVDSRRS
jgi:hypothetical protein